MRRVWQWSRIAITVILRIASDEGCTKDAVDESGPVTGAMADGTGVRSVNEGAWLSDDMNRVFEGVCEVNEGVGDSGVNDDTGVIENKGARVISGMNEAVGGSGVNDGAWFSADVSEGIWVIVVVNEVLNEVVGENGIKEGARIIGDMTWLTAVWLTGGAGDAGDSDTGMNEDDSGADSGADVADDNFLFFRFRVSTAPDFTI